MSNGYKSVKWMWPFVFGIIIFLAALIAASFFDLPIAMSITNQGNPFGKIVQDYGTLPQGALIVAAVLVLSVPRLRKGYPLLARGMSAMIMQAVLHPLLFCTSLKFLWGRVRPADMIVKGLEFTPFYIPNPGGGGLSFPSGHVAATLVLLPVLWLFFKAKRHRAAVPVLLFMTAWAGSVAYGRMLYGAHFLTDVLFSAGTAFFFVPLSIKAGDWYLARY